MKNEEILKKAIERAVKNGWKLKGNKIDYVEIDRGVLCIWFKRDGWISVTENEIIYRHDFAKCFWGGGESYWQRHLATMVLEKNPLDYLRRFL